MESGFSNAGDQPGEPESWGTEMASQICVEEGVEGTWPSRVVTGRWEGEGTEGRGRCPSLQWDIKLSWTAAGIEEKMASVSRRERPSVLRGSYFSLREMPS